MNKLVTITYQEVIFLTNQVDYLKNKGPGIFDSLGKTLQGVLADIYGWLIVLGLGGLGCALLAAFIMFGLKGDSPAIKENKQWIGRIIIAAIGVSSTLTIIGIAAGIGEQI